MIFIHYLTTKPINMTVILLHKKILKFFYLDFKINTIFDNLHLKHDRINSCTEQSYTCAIIHLGQNPILRINN